MQIRQVQTSFAALHERIASLEDGYMQDTADLEVILARDVR